MKKVIEDLAVNNGPKGGDINPNPIDVIIDINGSRRDNPKLEEDFGDMTPDRDIGELEIDPFSPSDLVNKQIKKGDFLKEELDTRPKRRIPGLVG